MVVVPHELPAQRAVQLLACMRTHSQRSRVLRLPVVFLCSAPTPSLALSKKTATGSCEVPRIERPPWHRAASGLEIVRGTTPIATVTSQRSGYIRTVDTQWLRGHGQSVVMRTGLIILLLQVFLCSAPTPSPASSKTIATGSCEVHRIERPPWHRAASGLELARGTTPIATVTSQRRGYIRTVDTQWLRGHGQSVVMRTEPIILLLQVFLCSAPTRPLHRARKRPPAAAKCIESKDHRGVVLLLD
ncbi:hypothetical protein MRX96_007414 [Rhipicephalus microplus]